MKPFLLAAAAAVLLVLGQPPFGWLPLSLVGLVPLLALAEADVSSRRRYLAAYVGGWVFFLLGCHWLAVSHPINLLLMTVFEALAFPLVILLWRAMREVPRLPRALALALAWTAVEYVRSVFPLGGFPWLLLGYSLHRPLVLAQAADLIGTYGLGFLVALANGLLESAWRRRRDRRVALAYAGGTALMLLALLAYGYGRASAVRSRETPGPRVAVVQANIPQVLKSTQDANTILEHQFRTSVDAVRQAGERGLDLMVWAETMLPFPLNHRSDPSDPDLELAELERDIVRRDLISLVAAPSGASVLLGAITLDRDGGELRQFNSAVFYDPSGARAGVYSKTVLVPGGEFIPLRWVAPGVIEPLVLAMAGFLPSLSRGEGPVALPLVTRDGATYRFGATICYENTYPGYGADVVRKGVDFIVNLSNEAWFEDSMELDQMDVASRFRAIEGRRAVVRATNSGISAVYDATGARRAVLRDAGGRDREIRGALVASVPISRETPVYVQIGDFFPRAVSVLATILAMVGGWWRRRGGYQARPGS